MRARAAAPDGPRRAEEPASCGARPPPLALPGHPSFSSRCSSCSSWSCSLRAVGYGVPMDFVLRQEVEGQPRTPEQPALHVALLRAGRGPDRRRPSRFPCASRRATYRVFVLGSSAAQGDPEPGFGIARAARGPAPRPVPRRRVRGRRTRRRRRSTRTSSTRSAQRLPPARARPPRRLRRQQRGRRTLRRRHRAHRGGAAPAARARGGRRAGHAARAARRERRARRGRRAWAAASAPGAWHGMEMFLEQQVRPSDPALERTYRNYEGNLADTCRLARGPRACPSS